MFWPTDSQQALHGTIKGESFNAEVILLGEITQARTRSRGYGRAEANLVWVARILALQFAHEEESYLTVLEEQNVGHSIQNSSA